MTKTAGTLAIAALCCAAFLFPARLAAVEIVPFDSTNQSPLIRIYGLPGPGRSTLLPQGRTEVETNVALSSNYAVDETTGEQIVLDGETTRFTVAARYGLSPRLEVGIKIPYVYQSGGFLDGVLDSYHDLFGFPDGGRGQALRDRLLYRYQRDGVDQVHVGSSGGGIGDLQLTAAVWVHEEAGRSMTFNAALKLPTGESSQLRGSGSTDLALWFHEGIDYFSSGTGKWASYGSAGILLMTEGDVLPDQQKKWVGFGTLGFGWSPAERVAFKAQLDAHTAFFGESDLSEIDSEALQLILGGTITLSERMALDIGVSEDLVVKTSPDVVFYFTLRTTF